MKKQIILLLITALFVLIALGTATAANGTTDRLNISNSGEEGKGGSWASAISSNGNYVLFYSSANNLVEDDTNRCCDVFVRDTRSNVTERVSVSSSGEEGNDDSYGNSISADGRYVVFESYASNLIPNDNNDCLDVFIYDRVLKTTERISVSTTGEEGNANSRGGSTRGCSISADGRYVVFESYASNLIPNDNNGALDVFIRDRVLNVTARVSVSNTGEEGIRGATGGSISADGRYVVFESRASNLVPDDLNNEWDVFVKDLQANTIELVSVATDGTQGNGECSWAVISSNGRYVVYFSDASNLVEGDTNKCWDIFVRDRVLNITERVSISTTGEQGDSYSYDPTISADGRYVVFVSEARNLVSDDVNWEADIFVHDRVLKTTKRVSISKIGEQSNYSCYNPSISGDGNYIIFDSYSNNLVPNDTNRCNDVFIYSEDNIPPTITATITPNLAKSGNLINITAYADSDTESIVAEVLGEQLNLIKQLDGSWSLNYVIPQIRDNIYLIKLTATDNSGNLGIVNANFRVDNTPPAIYNPKITPNLVKSGDIVVISTSTEIETENVTAEILGETFNLVRTGYYSWSTNYVIPKLPDGIYSTKLTVFDALGNYRSIYVNFRADNTAPIVKATVSPNLIKSGDYMIIRAFADSDTESMTAEILNQKYDLYKQIDGSWSTDYIFLHTSDGGYPFKFTAIDQAGNKGIAIVNLEIDNTPPIITATIEPNPAKIREKIKIIAQSSLDTVSACAIFNTLMGPKYIELQYTNGFWMGEYTLSTSSYFGRIQLKAFDGVGLQGINTVSYMLAGDPRLNSGSENSNELLTKSGSSGISLSTSSKDGSSSKESNGNYAAHPSLFSVYGGIELLKWFLKEIFASIDLTTILPVVILLLIFAILCFGAIFLFECGLMVAFILGLFGLVFLVGAVFVFLAYIIYTNRPNS